ncbi:3-hydroxyacyl-CoA dehydrogenase (plasmid) [Streptantibioticus cattleyicolor NRRL 8057 = DSM 46488]|uniref:3-hydroxyacyl-CoA dehydrogenase n=1 Tax=Streptantibioticus cattleyicolor (strain ATCC 35852 / DSM 46488 / JCM 4925 / NBRC 14057 / NRRL 8057) TaxID=1003195 RepID=G8XDU4_STREN|nr:3-hydroxyacyl-CoA dehydrogenase [Streptantibioticus cattleyicolor NRRL 8057 = DSM 46488]
MMLAHGLRVTVSDPQPDVESRVRRALPLIAPALRALGLPVEDLDARLSFEPDLARAVADADVVQENGPERLDFKRQLFAAVEEAAPAGALLLSSTSGLRATDICQDMRRPGRLLVGHPFNPPHLVPLVEVVPGQLTDESVVTEAVAFYRALGKRPQVIHKEVPGFVANRLQSALFREAVHLVAEGVVTEAELDDVVTSSIGLRWAVAGPFRTFHLGGGPGGLTDFLEHFGRNMEAGWAGLGHPRFDEATVRLLSRQAERDFGGRPYQELEAERDRGQIAVLRALGRTPADHGSAH